MLTTAVSAALPTATLTDLTSSSSSSTTSSSQESTSVSPTTTSTPTPITGSGNSSAKLAGAIVGPICGVALILGLAYMFYRRKQSVGTGAPQVAHAKHGWPEPGPVVQPSGPQEVAGDMSYARARPPPAYSGVPGNEMPMPPI